MVDGADSDGGGGGAGDDSDAGGTGDDGGIVADLPADVRRFETTQRLDPDAFNHAKSRVDGGFDTGVEAFVTDDDGRLLLVCEDGRWSLPGGEMGDDSPETAAATAVEAATGLAVTVEEPLAVNEVTLTDGEREATLSFVLYGATPAGSPEEVEPGRASISGVEWYDELPSATIDRGVLADLLDSV